MSTPTRRLRLLMRRASTEYVRLHNLATDLHAESAAPKELAAMVSKAQGLIGEVTQHLLAIAAVKR